MADAFEPEHRGRNLALWMGACALLAVLSFARTSAADLTPQNMALGMPATQSSTLGGADASRAVDGNTDGILDDGSVTLTNIETNAWWQVDLGQSRRIGSIKIFNRTDCCADYMVPFVVLVSDIPLIDNDIVATGASAYPGIMRTEVDYISTQYSIPINRTGRYVRIALLGQNYLTLAEVQVNEAFNAALGRTATQSSTLAALTDAGFAVDGYVNGLDAVTGVETYPWWQVDLGTQSFLNGMDIWSGPSSTPTLGYYVFASPTPFTTDPMVSLPPGATKTYMNAQGAPAGVSIGIVAQYIRIVLNGTGSLALQEVQAWPVARGAVGAHGSLSSLGSSFANPNGATDLYDGAQRSDPTTAFQTDPYLDIDLGGERPINDLKIWGEALNSSSTTFSLFVSTNPFTATTVAGTRAEAPGAETILRGTTDDVTVAVMGRARFIRLMIEGAGQRLGVSEVEVFTPQGYVNSPYNTESIYNDYGGHTVQFSGAYDNPGVVLDVYEYNPDSYATPYGFDDSYVWIGSATSSSTPTTTNYSPFPGYAFNTGVLSANDTRAWPLGGMGGFVVVPEDNNGGLRSFDFNTQYGSELFSELTDENLFWPQIRLYSEGWADAEAYGHNLPFLSLPMGNKINTSYYNLFKSGSYVEIPTTYAAFKKQYFPSNVPTVNAKYYNNLDLGIGRNMTCAQPTWKANTTLVSGVVCAVDNFAPKGNGTTKAPVTFGDATDTLPLITAAHPAPFATVVMVARTGVGPTFGVYDKNGNRIQSPAYLDGTAYNTAVPNNCVTCHGGTAGTTVVSTSNRYLLPFDPAGFLYETAHPYTQADQSEAFRKLNAIVLASMPTPAIADFINGTYHGNVNVAGTQADLSYIPAGWATSDSDRKVYQTVIKPFCRNCHMSQLTTKGGFDMLKAQDLLALRALVVKDACVTHRMPQAEFPFNNLNYSGLQGDLLGYFGRLDSAPGLDEMCAP